MSKPLRILGIAGSLRCESYNCATLRAAIKLAPEASKQFIRQLLQGLVDWTRRIS